MTTIIPFDNYEISGCKAFDEDNGGKYFEPADDSEADCWTLYGHTQGEGVIAIGDFSSRAAAEEVYAKIVGELFTGSYEANPALQLRNAAPQLLAALQEQEMAEHDPEAARRKGYFDRARELRKAALAKATRQ